MRALERLNWIAILPLVLVGLRSAMSQATSVSLAQLTYGGEIRLPGEVFTSSKKEPLDVSGFVKELSTAMQNFNRKTSQESMAVSQ